MRYLSIILFSILLFSCDKTYTDAELAKINGYWEIESVVMKDSVKEYKVNSTIDYFELKGKTGFRKKVMPQLDGTYRMNDLSEKLEIVQDSGKVYIHYKTDYAQWQEEIVELTGEELVLKNSHNMEYHYKKPEPFTVK